MTPDPDGVMPLTAKPTMRTAATRYRGEHKPRPDGRCEHRWLNRQTQVVHCGWADGFRAALAALRVEVEGFRAFGVSGDYDRALEDVLRAIARATETDAGEESRE